MVALGRLPDRPESTSPQTAERLFPGTGVAFGLALGLVASAVGQGQFDMVRLPVTGSIFPRSGTFAIDDLDRDGDPDLVWAVADGLTVVLLNEGQLRFVPITNRLPGSIDLSTIWLLGDVDGDGAPDILIEDAGGVAIWRNDGRGFFSIDRSSLPPRLRVRAFALADFDGDGLVDIAAAFDYPLSSVWRSGAMQVHVSCLERSHPWAGRSGCVPMT